MIIKCPKCGHKFHAIRRNATTQEIYAILLTEPRWTTGAIRTAIVRKHMDINLKAIYNSLGYLTRMGYVQRVGYGEYAVPSAPQGDK